MTRWRWPVPAATPAARSCGCCSGTRPTRDGRLTIGALTAAASAGTTLGEHHPHLLPLAQRVLEPTERRRARRPRRGVPRAAARPLGRAGRTARPRHPDRRLRRRLPAHRRRRLGAVLRLAARRQLAVRAARAARRTRARCAAPAASPYPAATRPRRCWRCCPRSPRTSSSPPSPSSRSAAPPAPAGPRRPTCSARRSSARRGPTTSAARTGTPPRSPRACGAVTDRDVTVSFTPVLIPTSRGILATCTARTTAPLSQLRAAYEKAYDAEPFVHLLPEGQLPQHRRGDRQQRRADRGRRRRGRRRVRRDRRDRQPGQGHRRRGRAVDEPRAGLAGDRRPFDRGGGAVTDDCRRRRRLVRTQGVTAPAGFRATGIAAGIKASGALDLALVFNEGPDYAAAGVFTRNQVKAAPVLWTPAGADHRAAARGDPQLRRRQRLHRARAGSRTPTPPPRPSPPRCRTGAPRPAPSRSPSARPGLIGDRLPMDKVLAGVSDDRARDGRRADRRRRGRAGHHDHRHRAQTGCAAPSRTTGPSAGWPRAPACWRRRWRPCCACITTDAVADAAALDTALRSATALTFDRLDVDGSCSTNDTVLLLASGASEITPSQDELDDAVLRGVRRPVRPAAGRRRRRHQAGHRHRDRRGHRGRRADRRPRRSPATAWSRPRCSAPTRTGAGCWPRSAWRRSRWTPTGSRVSFNGSPVCVDGVGAPGARDVDLSGADIDVTVDLGVGDGAAPPSAPPTCRTPTSKRTRRTAHERAARAFRPTSRPQVLAEALPWLKQLHGKIVVVKYGGNAMTDDALRQRVRRRHGVPAQLRHPSRRRARRRPADQRDAETARHRRRFQGRIPGHHTRSARRRADGAVRSGRPRTGRT